MDNKGVTLKHFITCCMINMAFFICFSIIIAYFSSIKVFSKM